MNPRPYLYSMNPTAGYKLVRSFSSSSVFACDTIVQASDNSNYILNLINNTTNQTNHSQVIDNINNSNNVNLSISYNGG